MSADNYLVVDHDGEVFQIFEGSMSAKMALGNYEPFLIDTADDVSSVESILEDSGYAEYGVEWTSAANKVKVHDDSIEAAVEKVLDKLGELNAKVVRLANKLDEHMKERDAHNPAMMYKK